MQYLPHNDTENVSHFTDSTHHNEVIQFDYGLIIMTTLISMH